MKPSAVHSGEDRPWHGCRSVHDEHFLNGLIDGIRCGILAMDREGRLVMLNQVGAQILDLPAIPSMGMPIREALPEYPELTRILSDSFEMSSLPNRAQLELKPGAVNTKTIGFTVSMIPGVDGAPNGAAIFFKDLAQVEHLEEQQRLKDRLAALGQMAASMAHEIRNPLASIQVTCTLLRRRMAKDTESAEFLDKIVREVRRLDQHISASLEFVRPVPLKLELAEPVPILEDAIRVAVERCGKSDVQVCCRFSPTLGPFLVDRAQLRQVFENLVLNALEAMDGRGTVSVEAEVVEAPSATLIPYPAAKCDREIPRGRFEKITVIRVADTGPGINEVERDRVFIPFFTTKTQGSGVGLATAKKIVDAHRGLIDVGAAPGGGALFTVRLPMIVDPVEG